jgi:hypothetical protein
MLFSVFFVVTVKDSYSDTIPALEELEKGIMQRVRSYDGLEFSVTSKLRQTDIHGKQVIHHKTAASFPLAHETWRFHFPEQGPCWKTWIQKIQDDYDQEWIVNRFAVTNVSESRSFNHVPEGEGIWNDGGIIPWYVWDPAGIHSFSFVLGYSMIGISLIDFEVSQELRQKSLMNVNLEFTGECLFDGIKTWIFQGTLKNIGTKMEVHVTSSLPIVVFLKIEDPRTKQVFSCEIKKLSFFETICYPQKGSFRQTAVDSTDAVNYEFEVMDVHRFDKKLLNNWFPEWPPSTIVADIKTGTHITIPPNERQMKKVADGFTSKIESEKESRLLPFRIFLIIAGAVLIIISVYLSLRKRYNNKK